MPLLHLGREYVTTCSTTYTGWVSRASTAPQHCSRPSTPLHPCCFGFFLPPPLVAPPPPGPPLRGAPKHLPRLAGEDRRVLPPPPQAPPPNSNSLSDDEKEGTEKGKMAWSSPRRQFEPGRCRIEPAGAESSTRAVKSSSSTGKSSTPPGKSSVAPPVGVRARACRGRPYSRLPASPPARLALARVAANWSSCSPAP
jgi:hypothetical protein